MATRAGGSARRAPKALAPALSPMLAASGEAAPSGAGWVYEPKYDGIRIVAWVAPDAAALFSRNGNPKTAQFPEVAEALRRLAAARDECFVMDGELVALDARGRPARFQSLQGRLHLVDAARIAARRSSERVGFVAFDLLMLGDEVLLRVPWRERRERLDELLAAAPSGARAIVRPSALLPGSPGAVLARARASGWEGVIAKRVDSPYLPGRRTSDWRKLKVEARQEMVVGGYTEPRNSREHLGALLLGYYNKHGELVYAGHTGTGLSRQMLATLHRRLHALEQSESPFTTTPRTNEAPHWVRPQVVVEVRFNEWTREGKLRQPVFVGMRDDKDPRQVVREPR